MRFVRGGEKELVEKLGRNDLCPCSTPQSGTLRGPRRGSAKSFQALLP